MRNQEDMNNKDQSDDDDLPKVFLSDKATQVGSSLLYRGTYQIPQDAFYNGMQARGTNTDILLHLDPFGDLNPDFTQATSSGEFG